MRNQKVNNLVTMAMLAAIAFGVMMLSKLIPDVSGFLSFDLKDVVIVMGGFIFGALPAALLSATVALLEFFIIGDTGWIGLVMDVVSSCAFCCTAAAIYKKRHTQRGAIIGLVSAVLLTTAVMLLWNYLLTPLYTPDVTRQAVAGMLLPLFLPFNLVKAGINATLALLLYKPLVRGLRAASLLPKEEGGKKGGKLSVILLALAALVTLVLLALVLMGKLG